MPDLDLDLIARRVEAVRQFGVNARFVDPQPIRLPISSMYGFGAGAYIAAERICLTDAPALIAAARERDGLRALLKECRDLFLNGPAFVALRARIDAALKENDRG